MFYTVRFIIFVITLFNLGEFFSDLPEKSINVYVICVFIVVYFFSLLFSSHPDSSRHELNIGKTAIRKLFAIIIFSNILLIYFIIKNIGDNSIIGLAIFMEKYRNGFFHGSGIFTFLSTNLVPLLLSYYIYYFRISKKILTLFLIFSIIPLLLLGLRVFVIPIILSLLFKHFNRNKFFSKQSVFIFLLLILLTISTKLLLIPETISNSFTETILKVLTRTNYQAIIVPNGIDGGIANLLLGSVSDFKDLFYMQNYQYIDRLYLTEISNSSGIAIPLLPLLIIVFGYFPAFIITLCIFVLIFYISFKLDKNNINNFSFKTVFSFYSIIFVLAAFIEDFSFLYKIFYIPFLWIFIYSNKSQFNKL